MVVQAAANPSVDAILRQDVADSLAHELDAAVFAGATGGANPVGIINTAGINTQATATASTLVADDVFDALEEVLIDNSLASGLALSPTAALALKKQKDSQGRPLNHLTGFGTQNVQFDGMPAVVSTTMPALADGATPVLAGRFSDSVLAIFGGGLSILTNQYGDAYYSRGSIGVRGIMTADHQVRQAASFCTVEITAA